MIDWKRVCELHEEVGEDSFNEVIDLFLFEVEDELARLSDCHSPETLSARLHFLKGCAINIGFTEFSALCQAGEVSGGTTVDVESIRSCYSQSKEAFLRDLHRIAAA